MPRQPKFTHTKWTGLGLTRQTRYAALFNSREFQSVFDAKFFDRVDDRLYDLQKRGWTATALQASIFIALIVSLIHLKVKFNMLGISSEDINGAKEVLIIISAGIGIYWTSLNLQVDYLKEMLNAKAAILAGNNDDAKNVLLLAYGIPMGWDPPLVDEHVKHGWPRRIMTIISLCLLYLLKFFLWCTFTVLHLMIMIDIYQHPNFTPAVSVALLCLLVLLTCMCL
jgi:hypothetical protein